MEDDGEIFKNKRSNRFFVSPRFERASVYRIASQIMDDHDAGFATERNEVVLRVTNRDRFEIKATFTESDRGIRRLTFQRWNVTRGIPHDHTYFTFRESEIPKLLSFVEQIRSIHFDGPSKVNVAVGDLQPVLMTPEQARRYMAERQDIVIDVAMHDITQQDIVALAYRKKQLAHFERLLTDEAFFASERQRLGKGPEPLWQAFFEANTWILGHGLSYVFMSGLDGRKLEQTVKGTDLAGPGKVTDGIMKTNARMNAVAFVEVKRHDTPLLRKGTYRSGVWGPSDEFGRCCAVPRDRAAGD